MRATINGQAVKRRLECQAIELNFEILQLARDHTEDGCAAFGMSKALTAKVRKLDDGALINLSNTSVLFFSPSSGMQMHEAKWLDKDSEFKARMLVYALYKMVNDAMTYIGDSARMVLGEAHKSADLTELSLEDLIDTTENPERKLTLACAPDAFEKMVDAAASGDLALLEINRNILATA